MSNAPIISLGNIDNKNIPSLWDVGNWDVGNWDTTFPAPAPFGVKLFAINIVGGEVQTLKPILKSSPITVVGGEVQILKPIIKL